MTFRFPKTPAFSDTDKTCPISVSVGFSRMDFPAFGKFRLGKAPKQLLDRNAICRQLEFKTCVLQRTAPAPFVKRALRLYPKERTLQNFRSESFRIVLFALRDSDFRDFPRQGSRDKANSPIVKAGYRFAALGHLFHAKFHGFHFFNHHTSR